MSESLFSADRPELRDRVPPGLPLVVALTGLSDAGGAVAQLEEFLWTHSRPEEIVRFDPDLLFDYRARRPTIVFAEDHLRDYDVPELALLLARDDLGAPFLLLLGFEPDFRWAAFVDQVTALAEELGAASMTWVHSIPMPIPHTRPIGVTVSGSRSDLIEARSVWRPTTQLAATVGHLLEHRLHTTGHEATGFVLLVPHYLAENEVPDALLTALDCLTAATGLVFPTDVVREQGRAFVQRIAEQIAENGESQAMVAALEKRHDAYMEDRTLRSPLMSTDGTLPTADQIASELERFLAEQDSDGEPPVFRPGEDPGPGGAAGE